MLLEITTSFMTHLTTHGLESCMMFPPLEQISVKELLTRRVAHVTFWNFFSFSTSAKIQTKKFNCLDMDRKRIYENENSGNVYSFQKSRKY